MSCIPGTGATRPARWIPASHTASSDLESLVPRGGDGLALLAIGTDTADIREKYPGLARNVRSHVPGIGVRKQRLTGSLRDVGDPRFLGRGLRFNGNCPPGAHGRDEIGDEIHVLLDGDDHIAEDGRA